MTIPTEPIGSIPRPPELVRAIAVLDGMDPKLDPFRYMTRADSYLEAALRYAHTPLKQAVISPSALSLMCPAEELGTIDDCGFSPFCDDTSTSRDLAFAKIQARARGTALASEILGVR